MMFGLGNRLLEEAPEGLMITGLGWRVLVDVTREEDVVVLRRVGTDVIARLCVAVRDNERLWTALLSDW